MPTAKRRTRSAVQRQTGSESVVDVVLTRLFGSTTFDYFHTDKGTWQRDCIEQPLRDLRCKMTGHRLYPPQSWKAAGNTCYRCGRIADR